MMEGGTEVERYETTFCGVLVRTDAGDHSPKGLEQYIDLVVAELEQLNADDIDVSTNLETSRIDVSISLESADLMEAQEDGGATIRAAFHAAEIATPGWKIDWVK
jgi:hypothetical protein